MAKQNMSEEVKQAAVELVVARSMYDHRKPGERYVAMMVVNAGDKLMAATGAESKHDRVYLDAILWAEDEALVI
jgi:hypothetical protein